MSAAAAQPAPPPFTPTLAGRTVLVIEDHKDSREMLTAVLRSLQAHVVEARNIEEAEREMQFSRPHLIICDMKLPDGTGLDFVKWLRGQQRGAKTPCIAITGWDNHFPPSVAHGFDAYMRKPIDLDKFCTVAVALAQRH
jgi:CheY-like chemotaxis protein